METIIENLIKQYANQTNTKIEYEIKCVYEKTKE